MTKVYRLDDPALGVPYKGDDIATKAMQRIFDNLQDGDRVRAPLDTRLVLDEPLRWSDKSNTHLRSKSRALRAGQGAPVIQYIGPAGAAVVDMDRTRYCTLKGFDFDMGDAATGVNLDGYTEGHIGTECELAYCAFVNTAQRDDFTAVAVSREARQNQEYHKFTKLHVDGRGKGRGVFMGPSYNSKLTKIREGTYEHLENAIEMQNGGYKITDVNFTDNETNVLAGNLENACTDIGSISEHSRHHTRMIAQGTLTVIGGRHSIENTPAKQGYWEFNVNAQATLIGVSYDSPIPDGRTLYKGVSYRGLVFLNNYYSQGMTLEQLGLEVGKGKWFAAEMIGQVPFGAYTVISSQWNDGTAALINTLTMGQGAPDDVRMKGTRRIAIDLAKGAAIKPRSVEWRSYPVNGLTPDDAIVRVDVDATNGVHVVDSQCPRAGVLALRFSNPTASTLVPPSGAGELLVMRIAVPY